MNRNRAFGAAKTIVGRVKVKVGRAVGDPRMIAVGKATTLVGVVQRAVGRLQDTARRTGREGRRRFG